MMAIAKRSKTDEHFKRLVKISRLYYQNGLSQIEIAKQLNLSRPTIVKALQEARKEGIVRIEVVDPFEDIPLLEQQLQDKYQLKRVIVTLEPSHTEKRILTDLGKATADYLHEIVKDDDIIGINWGKTMKAVAEHLREDHHQNVKVVQLKGSVTNSREGNFSADITNKFNRAFHTQANVLPLPVIFGDSKVKEAATSDYFIKDVIKEGYDANIAIFTVGTTRPNAMLFRLGYLDNQQIKKLQKEAVGDVISHFITRNGQLADPQLDKRTVAIPLDELKHKAYSILVAGGEPKLLPIHAALTGGYANVLVVDQAVAKDLLKY
ncbi:sugar-binding transcriptional regulator [Lentilactobacillus dabitei]|uniref:sugar-binding transcriptional regulator n=1 Tax=Lentilactobacillus dabitei TaxID=2831523 RepID=UPI00201BA8A5|nr:sugar-binding transcriptional regulator [Lentilactobacillus dabitei]